MHSHQLTTGRTFGIRFDPGESFFPALAEFCDTHHTRQGYIPMFLAAFAAADIVGTCDKLDHPAAPSARRPGPVPGRDDPRRGHHPRHDPARGPRTLRCTAAELRRPAGILTGRCHGKRSTVLPFPGDARRRPLTPLSV